MSINLKPGDKVRVTYDTVVTDVYPDEGVVYVENPTSPGYLAATTVPITAVELIPPNPADAKRGEIWQHESGSPMIKVGEDRWVIVYEGRRNGVSTLIYRDSEILRPYEGKQD